MAPLLVSIPQAGKLLGISRANAWRIVNRGDLPAVRIGERRLVARADIAAFIEAHREPR
jgi:excisionase family DNA binding protein